jgi:hypothetical protein
LRQGHEEVIDSDRATIARLRPCAEQRGVLKAEDAQTPSDSNPSSAGTETGMRRHSVSPPRPPAGDED